MSIHLLILLIFINILVFGLGLRLLGSARPGSTLLPGTLFCIGVIGIIIVSIIIIILIVILVSYLCELYHIQSSQFLGLGRWLWSRIFVSCITFSLLSLSDFVSGLCPVSL